MKIKTIKEPGFEEIVSCEESASGLKAIVAIHNTRLGPALGGIRMYPYANQELAIQDVMRLANAMSYKSAAARLKLGGGKAVIIGNPTCDKTPELLKSMGKFIHCLKGRYYSAKDADITTEDLVEIAKETEYVTGLPESMGGSGDPSPWTAQSVLEGMRVCLNERMNRSDFDGVTVAVQGVGHVGFALAKLLHEEKARLIVSDVNPKAADRAARELNAEIVAPNLLLDAEFDIFAPCAMGAVVNDQTIDMLACKVIAGGANNQLADEAKHALQLADKNILYAPDYVINAGGVINIYVRDILKEKNPMPWIKKTGDCLRTVFERSKQEGVPPSQVADELTGQILAGGV